jgi:hypothetical protein
MKMYNENSGRAHLGNLAQEINILKIVDDVEEIPNQMNYYS